MPPLLTGHTVPAGTAPMLIAWEGARAGRLGAGDLCWSDATDEARAALVLEPEAPLEVALQMGPAMLVAICDALGAIGPPNLAMGLRWPGLVLANGGRVGRVDLAAAETAPGAVPDFLLVGFTLSLTLPRELRDAPGTAAHITALHEEGCGDIDHSALIGAVARHFLSALDAWEHDGFGALHAALTPRLDTVTEAGDRLVGVDEAGGAIIGTGQRARGVTLAEGFGIRGGAA
ncbi:biotin/lipoate--protein ligase family protein [Acidimangrovimonas pyrenivorans]|uniref:Biotin/lipoate--protein ligase family protein n=1 Tax=Acidimangrovimonas pyrenivorans TaxID=2030798 RepID=A0ABV7AJQ0_9RHOB